MPRRDQEFVYPKYCHLMLILFKPWRSVSDLKQKEQSWTDSFEKFRCTCDEKIISILNNMQILHECKDSLDDHFANRWLRHKLTGISTEISSYNCDFNVDDMFADDNNEDILTHLQSMDSSHSMHQSTINEDLICCLQHMDSCQIFDDLSRDPNPVDLAMDNLENDSQLAEQMIENIEQENEWRDCYEKRRAKWKKNQARNDPSKSQSTTNRDTPSMTIETLQTRPLETRDTLVPSIEKRTHPINEFCDVNSDRVVQDWSLNDEQARAFKIIAEHSRVNNPEPLRMFIGGPAGTGKSRVINALKDFFER
jgi:hypothetical protein